VGEEERIADVAQITYAKSLRKQIAFAVTLFVIWFVTGFFLRPLNTAFKQVDFLLISLSLGALGIAVVRKAAVAKCPYCQIDLFAVIESAKHSQIPFRHCPCCGADIELA
jgi:membrane-associated PAP2 superfamily phosphatase